MSRLLNSRRETQQIEMLLYYTRAQLGGRAAIEGELILPKATFSAADG
jgi:hypothetical protein